jgi:hypothetical protein
VSAGAGQLLRSSEERRSDAVPGMVRVDADLLDVRIAVEHLQPDEAEGRILPLHGDQESAVGESGAVGSGFRRWRVGHASHASSPKLLLTRLLKRADHGRARSRARPGHRAGFHGHDARLDSIDRSLEDLWLIAESLRRLPAAK